MHSTSATLLQRLRRPGAGDAWGRFVKLYTPLLFFWARRLGLDHADAADLVQEVFATLVQKLPDFEYNRNKGFRNCYVAKSRALSYAYLRQELDGLLD